MDATCLANFKVRISYSFSKYKMIACMTIQLCMYESNIPHFSQIFHKISHILVFVDLEYCYLFTTCNDCENVVKIMCYYY